MQGINAKCSLSDNRAKTSACDGLRVGVGIRAECVERDIKNKTRKRKKLKNSQAQRVKKSARGLNAKRVIRLHKLIIPKCLRC